MRRATTFVTSSTSSVAASSIAACAAAQRLFHNGPPRGGNGMQQGQQRGGGGGNNMMREQQMRAQMMQQQQQQQRGGAPQDFYGDEPTPAAPRRRMPPQQQQQQEDFEMPPQQMMQQRGGGRQPPQQQQMMSRQEEQQMMMMQQQQQQMMRQQQQRGGAPQQQQQQQQQMQMDEDDYEDEGVMEEQQPPEPPKKPEEQKLVSVTENVDDTGITVIKMKNKPVNSLSLELLKELNDWMLWLGAAEGVKGVVISSDLPLVFSAGLDLKEFVDAKPEPFKVYWKTFQEFYLIMHTFPRPLVAAVTGNAPAGGCIIALCCDYRIMAKSPEGKAEKPYRIGLNETKLGLVAPPWVMQSLSYVIGQRKAERHLTLGETPTAEEAEKIGLVDVVFENEADVIPAAIKEAAKIATISEEARWMTKDMMRRPLIELFASPEDREYDADFFASLATAEPVQKQLKEYVAKLGGGKKQ